MWWSLQQQWLWFLKILSWLLNMSCLCLIFIPLKSRSKVLVSSWNRMCTRSDASHCHVGYTNKKRAWMVAGMQYMTLGFRSSVMWCCVIGHTVPYILKEYSAFVYKGQAFQQEQPSTVCNPLFPSTTCSHCICIILRFLLCGCCLWLPDPGKWRHYVSSKCEEVATQLHSVTSQEN